ncbi:MAG: lactonase family protein [Nitrososphaeria archaeon]
MKRIFVCIGTYTSEGGKGIYVYNMDSDSAGLKPLGKPTIIDNPSFLAIDTKHQYLYAVSEIQSFEGEKSGAISAFSIDPETGELTFLNIKSSKGASPCYVTVDKNGKYVLVANYLGGSVSVLPLLDNGRLGDVIDFVQHKGSSVNPKRQEGPHAHSVILDTSNRHVFVPDLGLDKIMIYKFDSERGKLTPNDQPWVKTKPGAGPRIFTFHPNGKFAYVINEIDSSIVAFTYDMCNGMLEEIQTVSTLPKGFKGVNYAAHIQVAPSGKFLYGSNRGHDSIVIYEIDEDTGRLSCIGYESAQGRNPRNFTIHPLGNFMLVANLETDNIAVFRIDQQTGVLEPTELITKVPAPTCVKIL